MREIYQTFDLYRKQHVLSTRLLAILLLNVSFFWLATGSIRHLTRELGYNIHYSFVILFLNSPVVSIVFFLGWLVILSNLPFNDSQQLQIVVRIGKYRWFVAQMLYVAFSALWYVAINVLIFCVCVTPRIGFYTDWGKLMQTLLSGHSTVIQEHLGGLYLQMHSGMAKWSPIIFFMVGLCMLWILLIILGSIILIGNYMTQYGGFIVVSAFIVLQLFKYEGVGYFLYYISILSWGDIAFYVRTKSSGYPTIHYIIGILIGIAIIISGLLRYLSRKHSEYVRRG